MSVRKLLAVLAMRRCCLAYSARPSSVSMAMARTSCMSWSRNHCATSYGDAHMSTVRALTATLKARSTKREGRRGNRFTHHLNRSIFACKQPCRDVVNVSILFRAKPDMDVSTYRLFVVNPVLRLELSACSKSNRLLHMQVGDRDVEREKCL